MTLSKALAASLFFISFSAFAAGPGTGDYDDMASLYFDYLVDTDTNICSANVQTNNSVRNNLDLTGEDELYCNGYRMIKTCEYLKCNYQVTLPGVPESGVYTVAFVRDGVPFNATLNDFEPKLPVLPAANDIIRRDRELKVTWVKAPRINEYTYVRLEAFQAGFEDSVYNNWSPGTSESFQRFNQSTIAAIPKNANEVRLTIRTGHYGTYPAGMAGNFMMFKEISRIHPLK